MSVDATHLIEIGSAQAPGVVLARAGAPVTLAGPSTVADATPSVSPATGALVVAGGVGVGGDHHVGGDNYVSGAIDVLNGVAAGGDVVWPRYRCVARNAERQKISSDTFTSLTFLPADDVAVNWGERADGAQFVIPIDGFYTCSAMVSLTPNARGDRVLYLTKNRDSPPFGETHWTPSDTYRNALAVTWSLQLQRDDVMQVVIVQSSGDTLETLALPEIPVMFTIDRLHS